MFYLTFISVPLLFFFFFFNDTATTEIYTLSLHDALPIYARDPRLPYGCGDAGRADHLGAPTRAAPLQGEARFRLGPDRERSEEHTSELQSLAYLVCRLLLEKKKK